MFIVLTALCLLFRYIANVSALRAILSPSASCPTSGMGEGVLSPERAPERVYVPRKALGRSEPDRLPKGPQRVCDASGCLPGRGVRVRASRPVERLSAGRRSCSNKTRICLEGKSECERFHKEVDKEPSRLVMAGIFYGKNTESDITEISDLS